ncbi:MAG TPA: choice-of-anchor L domain-containing protein [Longimicrobiales bacterium]|nr:choice-of-anchor L domain-containing protein [Longimicrobiales bacterium]
MSSRHALLFTVVLALFAGSACSEYPTAAPDARSAPRPGQLPREPVFAKPLAAAGAGAATTGLVTADFGVHNAIQLAQLIAGAGVAVSNASFIGGGQAGGSFSGGGGIIGFDDGVILSTGAIASVVGPNTAAGITGVTGSDGDDALSQLALAETFDAAVLTFDFVPAASRIYVQYVFASEEYNEFVNAVSSDVFAFWVNGVNCATVGAANERVSINTINHGWLADMQEASNPDLFVNNDPWHGPPLAAPLDTEMDGLTVVLTCQADVLAGEVNTIRLGIADVGDAYYDSNVFIRSGSLSTVAPAPNAPLALRGVAASLTRIDLSWRDVSIDETRFHLQRRQFIDGSWGGYTTLRQLAADATGYADTGLQGGARYQYRVRSCNGTTCSAWLQGPYVETALPARPAGVQGTVVSGTRIDVAWQDLSTNEGSFRLQRRQWVNDAWGSWATIATPAADAVAFTDTGVVHGTQYQYRVAACNGIGCSMYQAAPAVATPPQTIPAAPSDVLPNRYERTAFYVTWTANSSNHASFAVQRSQLAGEEWSAWTGIGTADDTAWLDEGLAEGTTFRYRVNACNEAGCSDWALSDTISTPAPSIPDAPTYVQPYVVSATELVVWWGDASDNEDGFRVQRRQFVDGAWSSFTTVASPGAGHTSWNDTGVMPERRYEYRVRACNSLGCSVWVAGPKITTPPAGPMPPAKPTSLSVATGDSNTALVALSWTDEAMDETGYTLQRRLDYRDGTFSPWATVASLPPDSDSYLDLAVTNSTWYQYRLRACNGALCSAYVYSGSVRTNPSTW